MTALSVRRPANQHWISAQGPSLREHRTPRESTLHFEVAEVKAAIDEIEEMHIVNERKLAQKDEEVKAVDEQLDALRLSFESRLQSQTPRAFREEMDDARASFDRRLQAKEKEVILILLCRSQ